MDPTKKDPLSVSAVGPFGRVIACDTHGSVIPVFHKGLSSLILREKVGCDPHKPSKVTPSKNFQGFLLSTYGYFWLIMPFVVQNRRKISKKWKINITLSGLL